VIGLGGCRRLIYYQFVHEFNYIYTIDFEAQLGFSIFDRTFYIGIACEMSRPKLLF
jgi:hypothetical protein